MGRTRSFDVDSVLDDAIDLFWERGYEGTGIHEICRVTGLNPGSVYSAFGDKHGLFIAAIHRYMVEVSQKTIERLHRSSSARTGIDKYYETLIGSIVDGKRRWGCLVTNSIVEFAMRDPQIADVYRAHLARLESAFSAALERAKREGDLEAVVDTREGAAFLVCTTQGVNVLAKTQPSRQILESIVRQALTGVGFA